MTMLRELFWTLALGVIACFAFFVALGALALDDAIGVTVLVGVLVALWIAHALLARRHQGEHDVRLTGARERRGF